MDPYPILYSTYCNLLFIANYTNTANGKTGLNGTLAMKFVIRSPSISTLWSTLHVSNATRNFQQLHTLTAPRFNGKIFHSCNSSSSSTIRQLQFIQHSLTHGRVNLIDASRDAKLVVPWSMPKRDPDVECRKRRRRQFPDRPTTSSWARSRLCLTGVHDCSSRWVGSTSANAWEGSFPRGWYQKKSLSY